MQASSPQAIDSLDDNQLFENFLNLNYLDFDPAASGDTTSGSDVGAVMLGQHSFSESGIKRSTLFLSGKPDDSFSRCLEREISVDEALGIMVESGQANSSFGSLSRQHGTLSPLSYQSSSSSSASFLPSEYSPQFCSLFDNLDDVLQTPCYTDEADYSPLSPILSLSPCRIASFSPLVCGRSETLSTSTPDDAVTLASEDYGTNTIAGPMRQKSPTEPLPSIFPPPLGLDSLTLLTTPPSPLHHRSKLHGSVQTRESSPLSTVSSVISSPVPVPFSVPPTPIVQPNFLRRSTRPFRQRDKYLVDRKTRSDDDDDDSDENTGDAVVPLCRKRTRGSNDDFSVAANTSEQSEGEEFEEDPEDLSLKKRRTISTSQSKRPTKSTKRKDAKKSKCFLDCPKDFSRKADNRRHCLTATEHRNDRDLERCREMFADTDPKNRCSICGVDLSRKDARKRHEKKLSCGKRTIRGKGARADED